MFDPFDLDRFVQAQERVLPDVLRELRAGLKRSHWMWCVFPQLRGFGRSAMAHRYGLASSALGPRLRDCAGLVNAVPDRTIGRILGSPDDLKFRSSMTLFAALAPDQPVFQDALDRFFAGVPDRLTLELLDR